MGLVQNFVVIVIKTHSTIHHFFFNSRHIYILCKNDDQKHSIACCSISIMIWQKNNYRQVSNIKRTLVGDKIVDHSDIVGASPVGVAPTISSFCTEHLASIDWVKANVRWDENHLSFVIWCHLYQIFYGMYIYPFCRSIISIIRRCHLDELQRHAVNHYIRWSI